MNEAHNITSWNDHNICKVSDQLQPEKIDPPDAKKLNSKIEPWLTALFQSEHLSLFLGSGISLALHRLAAKKAGTGMEPMRFSVFSSQIDQESEESASKARRGNANIEDQIRVCNELIQGLRIYTRKDFLGCIKLKRELNKLENELEDGLRKFANSVLKCESNIIYSNNSPHAAEYLMGFLVSFASRSATRERLNIFTTNYDRIVEYGSELAGIRLIDRFIGSINPIFRSSRVEVDMHYNPPGIRGEPRYLEGVVHFTKLHGSLDWSIKDGIVRRYALPYGSKDITERLDLGCKNLLIYPNAAKDRETAEYPYVELFRDFAVSVCRPNSVVFVYGYSFGDDHINRVFSDMLAIPSTHLVIISFDDQGNRINEFYDQVKRPMQISLLIGKHFGDLKTLIDNYLPKPAIDHTVIKMAELLKARRIEPIRCEQDREVE